uniref:Uncharacterized protein n=1 Tax=Rhizophora mucronata TaxID=61149 RepID=A0A2P2LAG1_RHIMU
MFIWVFMRLLIHNCVGIRSAYIE